MANATARVAKATTKWTDENCVRSVETLAAETTFYVNALLGTDITGYLCKGDDTQAWSLAGVVAGDHGNPVLPIATAGAADLHLAHEKPRYIDLAVSGVAVTDIGKPVYALDDQTGTLNPAATTYANLVGRVADVASSGIARVELAWGGPGANVTHQAARVMQATGAQAVYKTDLGKTIVVPNTAALTITLPPVADCPAGSFLQFIKSTADAAAVTLDGNASETIDGATTYAAMDALNDCAKIVSTGTAWVIVARDVA